MDSTSTTLSKTCGLRPCFSPSRFTGKERDTESGNDYFGARYYASSMGRWMSPDWSAKYEPVPYAKLDDPQSLNLYAYVLNNPLTGIDPDGHKGCDGDAAAQCKSILDAMGNGASAEEAMNANHAAQQQNQTQSAENTLLAQNDPPPPPGGGRVNSPAQGQEAGGPPKVFEILILLQKVGAPSFAFF